MQLLNYNIESVLSQSDRTVVYRATDKTGQRVVLKLPQTEFPSAEQIDQYQHEFDLLRVLDSALVIQAVALLTEQNRPVLVLEGFEADSATNWLTRNHHLAVQLRVAHLMAEALQAVHQLGIIHRDVNPNNIILDQAASNLKLIDFGLATRLARQTARLINVTDLVGTLAYISPEQTGRTNRVVDYRTDLYSLGVTLYQLFSGQLPFNTEDPLEMVHAHLARHPQPLDELVPDFPTVVSDMVDKLLAKNADDRYQSARSVATDLRECQRQWEQTGQIEPFPIAHQDHAGRLSPSSKLYGREAEQAILLETFERTTNPADHRQAELLLIAGYSGIGKSVLVSTLRPLMRHGHFVQASSISINKPPPIRASAKRLMNWPVNYSP